MSFILYRQTTSETCGIACLMMALRHFGIEKYIGKGDLILTQQKYYQLYGADACKGTLGADIARVLIEKGLDAELIHTSEVLLENRDGYFSGKDHAAILAEHKAVIEEYALTVRIEKVDCTLLREELAKGRLVILQCFVEGDADGVHDHVMHWVVVYGTDGNKFRVADPSLNGGKFLFSEDEMEEYMKTPFGGCCISVGKEQP